MNQCMCMWVCERKAFLPENCWWGWLTHHSSAQLSIRRKSAINFNSSRILVFRHISAIVHALPLASTLSFSSIDSAHMHYHCRVLCPCLADSLSAFFVNVERCFFLLNAPFWIRIYYGQFRRKWTHIYVSNCALFSDDDELASIHMNAYTDA